MGRFERSEHGGGQADPQEALRRAREAVARERAEREETHAAPAHEEGELEHVEEALREHDEQARRERDEHRGEG
jgi:hypothetical protein